VASWPAWIEEVLCDFIGLITFGPSFVAAECNLLYSMDASGAAIGPRHPPVGCRANYLSNAASACGFDAAMFHGMHHEPAHLAFWESIRSRQQANDWFNVFPRSRIAATAEALRELFQGLPPALYESPTEEELSPLLDQIADHHVPPVGFQASVSEGTKLSAVDFRHILYAGWIAAASDTPIPFPSLNRLCEHAIMQQRAIAIEMGTK
jgi:hypothetical protein